MNAETNALLNEVGLALGEAIDLLYDACWQGSGNEPFAEPCWHNFLSSYEDADEAIPRLRAVHARAMAAVQRTEART